MKLLGQVVERFVKTDFKIKNASVNKTFNDFMGQPKASTKRTSHCIDYGNFQYIRTYGDSGSANRGKILKTTNGGINWNYMPTGTNYSFGAINFINANTGYIGGNRFDQLFNGVIMKTTDGGISWNEQGPVYNYFVTCFSFPDALTGYASAGVRCKRR